MRLKGEGKPPRAPGGDALEMRGRDARDTTATDPWLGAGHKAAGEGEK